jgi:hypothetical protein
LLARASGAAIMAPADPTHHFAALPANQFLVQAAKLPPGDALAEPDQPPRRSFEERARWTAELFERLGQADAARNQAVAQAQRQAYAKSHGHVDRAPAHIGLAR